MVTGNLSGNLAVSRRRARLCIVGGLALLLLGCRQSRVDSSQVQIAEEVVTPTPIEVTRLVTNEVAIPVVETVTPRPVQDELVICLPREPASLFAYDLVPEGNADVAPIFHALYEADTTYQRFAFQAHGLQKLPSLADGDAITQAVTVQFGDSIVNLNGQLVPLLPGTELVTAKGAFHVFDGSPISMTQMVVDYTLRPRVWSDGEPVTAQDSVFGFRLQQSGVLANVADWVGRTSRYEAIDDRQARWVSLPGEMDDTYFNNFAIPLPEHAWGQLPYDEIASAASEYPIGDGPFMLSRWRPGDRLHLLPNPHYYREDGPLLSGMTFRFVAEPDQALTLLLAGECHVIPPQLTKINSIPALQTAMQEDELRLHTQIGAIYDHLDFGINPYGEYATKRPDWFEDQRVRQAIALCLDRQAMNEDLLFGVSQPAQGLVPEIHPLYASDLMPWSYQPAKGNRLLDEVGYLDSDLDGVREYEGPIPWFRGRPFVVTLLADADMALTRGLAQHIQRDLASCGIEVEIVYLAEDVLYGPESPIFARAFDLSLFAWRAGSEPSCRLYHSDEITGPEEEGFCGWAYCLNATGFQSQAYDAACSRATETLPGQPAYKSNYAETQRILAEQLPSVPLLWRIRAAIVRPEVANFELDPTQPSSLSNLYALDLRGE